MLAPWAIDEFRGVDLNDKRLNQRAVIVATQFGSIGESSPDAMNSTTQQKATTGRKSKRQPGRTKSTANLDALYRFVRNQKVTPKALLQPHSESTVQRTTKYDRVLLVQDTTEVNLTKPKRQVIGAGPLSSNSSFGFYLHPLVAYNLAGVPLGSVACHHWTRDAIDCESTPEEKKLKRNALPIEDKESYRWLEMVRRGQEIAAENPGTEYVGVSDSESDIGEVLGQMAMRPENYHLILRACQNRAILSDDDSSPHDDSSEPLLAKNIQEALSQGSVRYKATTNVRGRTAKTAVERRVRQQSRKDRTADLEVRAVSITIRVKLAASSQVDDQVVPRTMTLNVVEAREVNPPNGEPPIHWILLTTLPIDTEEEVRAIIDAYKIRWLIEILFMTLKSGLHLEELQYRELSRYLNATMMLLVVAWRVQCLTQVGRDAPDTSCDEYFDAAEWKAAQLVSDPSNPLPATAPTMGEFMILVAELGGYINRRQQGPPGVRTIWRGIRRLETLATAYRAFGPEAHETYGL